MKKKIILLTGSENRHIFLHNFLLQSKANLLMTYSEDSSKDIKKRLGKKIIKSKILKRHFYLRKKSEIVYFQKFNNMFKKKKIKTIKKKEINSQIIVNEIKYFNPDLIICFGCSIVKKELIKSFKNRMINIHLGLSPYYRGSGTNVWTLINNEPELFGATFMLLNSGIDKGKILHQIRAKIKKYDSPHDVGNRLIKDLPKVLIKIIENYQIDKKYPIYNFQYKKEKYYITKDFTPRACQKLYSNFRNNMINKYLKNKLILEKKIKIAVCKEFV